MALANPVPSFTGTTVSSAAKSMTVSFAKTDSNTTNDDNSDVFFSDGGEPYDSSDEYDTDLDIPRDSRTPQPENKSEDELDVICREAYRKACSRPKPTPTFEQQRIKASLSEREMKLKYRSIGSHGVKPLSVAMTNNLRVERLDLQYADMRDEGVKDLATALSTNITVSYLNLGNNNIGTEGVRWVAYLLTKNRLIKHLSLEGNNLSDASAPHLALAIEANSTLSIMDLSYNSFCDSGPKLLAAALGLNTGLRTLRLNWNKIRGRGAVAICQSLKFNDTLKMLDVSMNGFGYEGSLAMSKSLKSNNSLRELDMSANRLNWKAALLLSEGLKENAGLEILRLGRNPLTTTGCLDITEAITSPNSKIKFLDLTDVPVLVENEVLADAIKMRKDFRFLHGGIVMTPDVLGERKARKKEHIEILMEYLRDTCIRPLELLRDYDKSVSFAVPQDQFAARLVATGIPLHKFEIRALARAISEHNNKRHPTEIDYRKLIESVTEQIVLNRIRIKREKFEAKKKKKYHRRILASGLPVVPYGPSSGRDSKQETSRNTGSTGLITFSNLDLGSLSITSLPSLNDSSRPKKPYDALYATLTPGLLVSPNTRVVKTKVMHVSMTAPLGQQGLRKKKKRQPKKRRKSKLKKPAPVETLVSKF